jgi:hypothetical protein
MNRGPPVRQFLANFLVLVRNIRQVGVTRWRRRGRWARGVTHRLGVAGAGLPAAVDAGNTAGLYRHSDPLAGHRKGIAVAD